MTLLGAVADDTPSPLPPPLAPWPKNWRREGDDYDGEPSDDDYDGDDIKASSPRAEDDAEDDDRSTRWSSNIWQLWNPTGTATTDLPPVAVAALADSIAAAGQSPSFVVADLRAELADNVAGGLTPRDVAVREEAAIGKLEKELCGGAVPADKCAKCRIQPRTARMVSCEHLTLCTPCASSIAKHVNGHDGRSKHLCRLMCPICRGFEVEESASSDAIFDRIDRDGNGVIESSELLLHLLVAGQDAESISELFAALDADADGVISREEWSAGFERFLGVASSPPKRAPPAVDYAEPAPAEDAPSGEATAAGDDDAPEAASEEAKVADDESPAPPAAA